MAVMIREVLKIAELANQFTAQIQKKKEELALLEFGLEALQDRCPHDEPKMYRDRRIGTCSFCQRRFLDTAQVDAIFSE